MPTETKNFPRKICEACGKEFSCGAEIGKCWCFQTQIAPEDLAYLKSKFSDCLCRECLTIAAYRCKIDSGNL